MLKAGSASCLLLLTAFFLFHYSAIRSASTLFAPPTANASRVFNRLASSTAH